MRSSITNGTVLSDPVQWTAQPVGLAKADAVAMVQFVIDGRVRWTEHQAPYFFNDDHNHLFPWVLGAGPHRLGLRLITTDGNRVSTTAQVLVPAQQQPATLVGTYNRTVTPADINRTRAFRNEPPTQVPPAGTWRVRVERDGVFLFDDPHGGGGTEAFTALSDGTLTMQGPVNWIVPPSRQGSFCGVEPKGSYHWRSTGRTLVLTPHRDACADRNSIFTGSWTRR